MKVGKNKFWKCPVIIRFENLTSRLLSRTPKISIYNSVLPLLTMDVKSDFLLRGKKMN
jgi:hypothetical protein